MLLADMIDGLLGNPVERPKYESLLADDRLAPKPKEKPFDLLAKDFDQNARRTKCALMAINKVMDILRRDTDRIYKTLNEDRHTAFKESVYGKHADTFNFKRIEKGTVGHGGMF